MKTYLSFQITSQHLLQVTSQRFCLIIFIVKKNPGLIGKPGFLKIL